MASPLSLPFSIPLPFIFQEAKESIDEEDPRPTSSNGACITTPEQFRAEVAWPRDWPEAHAGEAPVGSPADAEEARMEEEMTKLLDFLGRRGAT